MLQRNKKKEGFFYEEAWTNPFGKSNGYKNKNLSTENDR